MSALGHQTQQPSPLHANHPAEQYIANAPTFSASTLPPSVPTQRRQRRVLLETLADPHTIRLLLYTGAAMLVVGVVIWLRDVLYLKLQEPIVQAALLVTGTIIVTVSGWLAILRTRLLLTGRALTLIGSLLVPVNFWFLVRSGLIENHGRAWIVCAFCALLYASTAALLREKLYVYLASVAAIATAWTIIYRIEREAFGLYALSLMTISLIFLHLFRLRIVDFGLRIEKPVFLNPQSAIRNCSGHRSFTLHSSAQPSARFFTCCCASARRPLWQTESCACVRTNMIRASQCSCLRWRLTWLGSQGATFTRTGACFCTP